MRPRLRVEGHLSRGSRSADLHVHLVARLVAPILLVTIPITWIMTVLTTRVRF
jgi:hypothetical protein